VSWVLGFLVEVAQQEKEEEQQQQQQQLQDKKRYDMGSTPDPKSKKHDSHHGSTKYERPQNKLCVINIIMIFYGRTSLSAET